MKKPKKTDDHTHARPATPQGGRAKRPAPGPVVHAVVKTIRAILSGPVTPRTLRTVAEFAEIGERALIAERSAAAGFGAPSRRAGNSNNLSVPMVLPGPTSLSNLYPTSADDDDSDGLPTTPAYASSAETWATRMMREIVSMFAVTRNVTHNADPDPEKTVRAIAAARSLGQTELAEKLERRLVPQAAPAALPPVVGVTPPAKRARRPRGSK